MEITTVMDMIRLLTISSGGRYVFYSAFYFLIAFIQVMAEWLNLLGWQLETKKNSHYRFFSEVIKFRQSRRVFGREDFLNIVNFLFFCIPNGMKLKSSKCALQVVSTHTIFY